MESRLEAIFGAKYVIKNELPSYIKIFDDEFSGAFVHNIASKSASSAHNLSDSGDLEITGSPLKYSFSTGSDSTFLDVSTNWLEEETSYVPLPDQEARTLLQKYTSNYHKDHQDCPPVWVLCKGNCVVRAVALVRGWWSRMFITQHSPQCLDDIDLRDITASHASIARMSDRTAKCQVTATCGVGTSVTKDKVAKSKVTVELRWNQAVKKPPQRTTAIIKITCETGSDTDRLWRELMFLYKWVLTLRELSSGREVKLPGCGGVLEKLSDTELLKVAKRGTSSISVSAAIADDSAIPFDITDKMWLILSESSELSELKQGFHLFFGHVISGEVNSYVRPTNSTTVARKINEINSGKQSSAPEILEKECVEFLTEIGIEKLINEYSHIFLSTNLLPSDKVKLGLKLSERKYETENCMRWLAKRHAALELVAATEKWLMLNLEQLSAVASDAVVHCDSTISDMEYLLNNQIINMQAVVDTELILHCVDSDFLQFRVCLTSENEKLKVKSVFLFSKVPIFPRNICYVQRLSDASDRTHSGELYEYSELRQISDKTM